MAQVVPLPNGGFFLPDARGDGRLLRLTWHPEAAVVVISLWRSERCVATYRLPIADVPALIGALAEGLAEAPSVSDVAAEPDAVAG